MRDCCGWVVVILFGLLYDGLVVWLLVCLVLGLWCALLFLVSVLGGCDLMVFVNSVVLIDSLWYCVLLFADVLVVFGDV